MLVSDLKRYVHQIGINVIGLTHNIQVEDYQETLKEKQKQKKLYPRHGDIDEYNNPDLLLSNTKTIISIGISFQNDYPKFSGQYGYVSKSSYGKDYHQQLRELGAELVTYLKKGYPNLNAKVVCDTSILDDCHYAYLSGNGFYGKNRMIINEQYGSMVFYATILLDEALAFEQPTLVANGCGSCNLCVQACPTNSLNNSGFDYHTCLSHLTQTRAMIDIDKLNHRLYGCDTCSNTCPYNQKVVPSSLFPELAGYYDLINIIRASKKTYEAMFQDHSLLWLNYNIIKKNAILNLAYYWPTKQDQIISLYHEVKQKSSSSLLDEAFHFLFYKLGVNINEI
jgi:epoxyqueuosine reductase